MDTFADLKQAIFDYDTQAAEQLARQSLAEGRDPVEGMSVVMETLREVGDLFDREELWLPDLLSAAKTAQAAMPILEDEIKRTGKHMESLGTVVIGTVFGDLHSIGKSMVSVMLAAQGFKVVDLGTDVPAEKFVQAVKENQAEILAMSSLLTTTAPEQGKVIRALEEEGLRGQVKVMVGGGSITPHFANKIGADGYGATAPEAVQVARTLVGK